MGGIGEDKKRSHCDPSVARRAMEEKQSSNVMNLKMMIRSPLLSLSKDRDDDTKKSTIRVLFVVFGICERVGTIALHELLGSGIVWYLRGRMNTKGHRLLKKIKMQDSHKNNLLQLADYICGVVNRAVEEKRKFSNVYRALIKKREILVEIWPK